MRHQPTNRPANLHYLGPSHACKDHSASALPLVRLTAMLLSLLFLLLLQRAAHSQTFSFFSYTGIPPGLQVDSTGRTFIAADNYLYRLNAQLIQEERVDLGATIIAVHGEALALSSTGMLVVCLDDLSCSVYNASNLSAGPIRRVSNAIGGDIRFGVAIFTSGDSFYTGAITDIGQRSMVLQQFGEEFSRSSENNPSEMRNELVFKISPFGRQFYPFGGFVSSGFAYYVVVDYQPARALRLLRVCNLPDCGGLSTCGVTALYELRINCGFQSIAEQPTHVCAVSLVEDFSGISGPIAVINLCGSTNSICVVNITAVNEAMDAKYDSCIVSRTVGEEIGLAWKTGSSESCDTLPQPQVCMPYTAWRYIIIVIHMHSHIHFIFQITMDRCDTTSPVGLIIPNDGIDLIAIVRINFGNSLLACASVAVKVEQFSFVFVATHDSRIRGVSAGWLSQLVCM